MTDNSNQTPNQDNSALYVSTHEPQARPAPALETGVVLWIRQNLFGSLTDAALTIGGAFLIIATLMGITTWIVQQANWYSITVNFRQFMLGFYEPEHEWRVTITALYSVFFIGAAVAIWIRQIARAMLIAMIVTFIGAIIFPILIISTFNLPSYYVAAGNIDVVSGSSTEVPINRLAFTVREGEVVTIQLAEELTSGDESLAAMSGFVDRASNTLRNAAQGRLDAIERAAWLEETLQKDSESEEVPLLTEGHRTDYTEELAVYEEPQAVIDTFNINNVPIQVTIYDGSTGEPITETTVLTSPDDVLEVTFPEDGWYILEKVVADGGEGISVLQMFGIYPVLQSTTIDQEVGGFVDSFARMTDTYRELEEPPEDSSDPIALMVLNENQYRGERSLNDYLRVYVAPFLLKVGLDVSIVMLVTIFGYFVAVMLAGSEGTNLATIATGSLALLAIILWTVVQIGHPIHISVRKIYTEFLYPDANIFWVFLVALVFAGGLGYAVLRATMPRTGKDASSWFTSIGLGLMPIVFWIMVNGMYAITAVMWLMVLSMIFVSLLIYQLGREHGWTEIPFAVAIVAYTAYVAVLWISGGFDLPRFLTIFTLAIDPAGVPRFILWLSIIPMLFAAFSGIGLHIPGEGIKARWAVYGSLAIELFIISAGMALSGYVSIETEWALQPSDPRGWGGLLLTMALTIYGIIIAFPLGVSLALGRRSDLPVIKQLCTAYIELVRGSPLIAVLFFVQLLIPLLHPELPDVTNTYRALVAVIAFSAAYLAENVRGGLQSLPPGQNEAAKALGLTAYQSTILITLPQALRAVIPALVGQFISLFKDTSLVAIVGLFDLVKIAQSVAVQPEFFGTRLEGLFFISLLYFVFSYVMSYVSRLLEASGSGSTRRM